MPDSALWLAKPNIRGLVGTPIYCLQPITQSKQGFGGVDVLCQRGPLEVQYSFGVTLHNDREERVAVVRWKDAVMVAVYAPASLVDGKPERISFDERFCKLVAKERVRCPTFVVGGPKCPTPNSRYFARATVALSAGKRMEFNGLDLTVLERMETNILLDDLHGPVMQMRARVDDAVFSIYLRPTRWCAASSCGDLLGGISSLWARGYRQ